MAHSTSSSRPRKPRQNFPLTPRGDGRWCKRVRGKLHYFRGTAEEAESEWLRVKDDIQAGHPPRPKDDQRITLKELVNKFLGFKQRQVDAGELEQQTFDHYFRVAAVLIDTLGRTVPVADITSQDFERVRGVMSKRWGVYALTTGVQFARSIFRYGTEAGLLGKPVIFGPGFKRPSAKVIRKYRDAQGERMFSAEQLRAVLSVAGVNARAMTLLGINGGLGNSDVAMLTADRRLDLDRGWLNYARRKTGVARRIPLWPETVAALRVAIDKRPEPTRRADAALIFLWSDGRKNYVSHNCRRVAVEFDEALAQAKVDDRTFYDLRRTFQTVAEGTYDLPAVAAVMGHIAAAGDMSSIYRQRIDDERLRRVVNHVRTWLFGEAETASGEEGGAE